MITFRRVSIANCWGLILLMSLSGFTSLHAQPAKPKKVIAFFTGRADLAHISFVGQAHAWFQKELAKHNIRYDTTRNWDHLNERFLAQYDLIMFLDTRPEKAAQREAFETYMKDGGAWVGFHFAGFAMTPSDFNQDWDWYHNEFLGSGQFVSNTWRPTSAMLKVEDPMHSTTRSLPAVFKSAPSEWYRWQHDLTKNPDIKILLSIDPSSFPLGTGPKPEEIWHEGYYPVAWTHRNYRMVYVNMGHNDMDYENGTNRELSNSFSSEPQNQFLVNALNWLIAPSPSRK